MIYQVSKFFLYVFFKIYFRIRFEGQENIPEEGAFLLAGNHTSFLDPPAAGLGVPRMITFMAKKELFSGILGWWVRAVGVCPVARGEGDIGVFRTAQKVFKSGSPLILFPEGTRSEDGTLGNIQPGVGLMIKKATVPVVPVGINGAFEALPRSGMFPKPKKIVVRYGKPVDFSDLDLTNANREAYNLIAQRLADEIRALCN